MRPGVFMALGAIATVATMIYLLLRGTGGLGIDEVFAAIATGAGWSDSAPPNHVAILYDVRLPRVLVALFAGGSLAVAGTVMQAVFRNPLASPEIMGTAAGSALGAVIAIALGLASASVLAAPAFAFLAAGVVSFFVYAVAAGRGGATVTSILLAGMAMNSLIGAATAFVVTLFFGSWDKSSEILHWLMGGLDKSTMDSAWVVIVGAVGFVLALVPFLRDMDLLTLEDAGAKSLGVEVVRLRKLLLGIACGITATAVSCTGGIVFVGLVVPHMVRLAVGPAHRALLPCAAVAGGLILLIADGVCQAWTEVNLRIGVVTAVLGAPFFLFLLRRHQRGLSL